MDMQAIGIGRPPLFVFWIFALTILFSAVDARTEEPPAQNGMFLLTIFLLRSSFGMMNRKHSMRFRRSSGRMVSINDFRRKELRFFHGMS